jgi:malate dehydrogenase
MMEVAIVGAGDLGGAIAHRVARRGRVRRVTLVDERSQAASGKALDIMQAGPVEGFSTRVTSAADVVAAAGASVFVLADRLHGGEWQGEEGLTLLGRIRRLSPEAIVICAGAGHRELVERGTREAGWSRSSIFGSAPEALAGALRALVALELNGSAGDVALAVLGVPPAHIVVPWEEATIGGLAAMRALDEPARRRLVGRVAPLWPVGSYALATAAEAAVEAIVSASPRRFSAFVAPDDSKGRRYRATALPVSLGASGIDRVVMPVLNAHDRVALDNAINL